MIAFAAAVAVASSALAVFAPDKDELAFGARHAAAQMGVPFVFTHDLDEALNHPMVVMTGVVGGDFMDADTTARLEAYVDTGGVLVVDDAESVAVQQLAGIAALAPTRRRYVMTIDADSGDPGFAHARLPAERTIRLGNKRLQKSVRTQGYVVAADSGARVLGRFDDGTAALVERTIGKGRVYASGVAYSDSILRPQSSRSYDAGRVYDNGFEPSADVPQLVLRDWYLAFVPGAVVADPTPSGKEGALLLTHDVDAAVSIANMPAYTATERALGLSATYYVQTKTVLDEEDVAFFDAAARQTIASAFARGADIASHTVAHAPDWHTFAVGTGAETPGNYRPRVTLIDPDHRGGRTIGATLAGEVHVSQERLQACAPGIVVDALRTGYLLINPAQWTVMERYGYKYDSSYAVGEVMTSFPYTAMERRGFARESSIIEFPIVIADADGWVPMMPHLRAFETLLDDEAAIHGVATALIHTDVVHDKLDAERALATYARRRMWVGNLDAFGDFWRKRAATVITTTSMDTGERIDVTAPLGISGLTLDLAGPINVLSVQGTIWRSVRGGAGIVLGKIAAGRTVTIFVKRP